MADHTPPSKSDELIRLDYPHQWIANQEQLEQVLGAIQGPAIAVDTEFMRTNTYYPIAGVIQLFDGQRLVLIDPLEISDWQPLSRLFAYPSMIKVLHACSEDLELFQSLGIALPTPMFDTQVATALLGGGLNEGLQKLAARLLDLHLPKHETRSDWLQRPLTEKQIQYAKEDVIILLSLWQKLQIQLQQQNKLEELFAEGELTIQEAAAPAPPEKMYLKLRGGWKLQTEAQQLLAAVACWRERTARTKNIPRRFICKDDDLIQLALHQPKNMAELTKLTAIQGVSLRQFGKPLLDIIRQWPDQKKDLSDFVRIQPPLPKNIKPLYQVVKSKAHDIAEAALIQPTLLASRSMLEELVYWYLQDQPEKQPQLLHGWRAKRVGEELLKKLDEEYVDEEPLSEHPEKPQEG